jgi:hypothetical protein
MRGGKGAACARAPTVVYRVSTLWRRRRLLSAALLALLLVGAIGLWRAATQSAQLRQAAASREAVQDYLIALLAQADPLVANSPQPSTAALLEAAVTRARTELSAQPKVLADVLATAANAQQRKGDFGGAERLLGEAATHSGLDQRGFAIRTARGQALHYATRYAESEQVLRDALGVQRANDWPERQISAVALVDLLHSRGDYAAASEILAQNEPPPAARYATLMWQRQAAVIARDSADPAAVAELAAADPLLAQSGIGYRAIFGDHHPVKGLWRHAQALRAELGGDAERACALLTEVVDLDYATTPDQNVIKAYARLDRAWNALAQSDWDSAEHDLALAEATLQSVSALGHPRWAEALQARALLAVQRGEHAQASALLERAMQARVAQFGPTHPLTQDIERWRRAFAGASAHPAGARLADRRFQRWQRALAEA